MWASYEKQKGFTIVELLIVIVVIAILATITIVSYNGIQQRAKESQFLAMFDTYEKTLRLYNVTYGNYPATVEYNDPGTASDDTPLYACLGENLPQSGALNQGECMKYNTILLGKKLPLVDAELKKVVSVPSAINYPVITVTAGGDSQHFRGIMFSDTAGPGPILVYYAKGSIACGRGTKEYIPEYTLTRCTLKL
jgi:prepilin-type N-terminal cleavage/methylation domain-containing protein